MSYGLHGVRSKEASSLVLTDRIEIIETSPSIRYAWREIVRIEELPSHANRLRIVVSGGKSVVYAKNQRVRYKETEGRR